MDSNRIAFFLPGLYDGGAERVTLNLIEGMLNRNIPVDLVLANTDGPYLKQVPDGTHVVNFGVDRVLKACLPLARYLREVQPFALISHLNHANVIAIVARSLAQKQTHLAIVEHSTLSKNKPSSFKGKILRSSIQWLYSQADSIIGVSQGVSTDLEQALAFTPGRVKTLYNPVVSDALIVKSQQPLNHPWFVPGAPPVFLSVGRLSPAKDFPMLLRAFAQVRQHAKVRLLLLGEGELRSTLESLIQELGLTDDDVSLPGFVDNPFAYMSQAHTFVLSSQWEGLPTVLIEAMACGCPVISTDCLSGPREILDHNQYGVLVPVGDDHALAQAMLASLQTPSQPEQLKQRSMFFSIDQAVSQYLNTIGYSGMASSYVM